MPYELHYWPMIQGRGEFVRLALEEAGADYVDVARQDDDAGGIGPMLDRLSDPANPRPPFAPPFLRDGDRVIGQTAAILLHLGQRLGLAGNGERDRIWTHQLQLTIADAVDEVHDTHHPLGVDLYYTDQKTEALRRAAGFRTTRMPKFFGYFERVLAANGGAHLVGADLTYADLSLFQLVDGLTYAFPKGTSAALQAAPCVERLHDTVARRPRIATYLASERRIPFSEDGIFRRYPELDG
ncbi:MULTISPECIES: glutathione S-transferase [unclassified Methylobacterium]|uniref:glutathione S-transferase n=1 Tax=unclassified Methylobacterium TaxID=2615210 RepID=UPI00226A1B5B|nr:MULTISPECIES: glutathione S-transferase [unclassified Methylobacterium]